MSAIDVSPGDLLRYVRKKPKKRQALWYEPDGRANTLLVLEQVDEHEAIVLMSDGEVGKFALRGSSCAGSLTIWDWTMSDWERM